jgi:hypothetical protein
VLFLLIISTAVMTVSVKLIEDEESD